MATLTLLLVLFLHVSSVLPLGQRATVDRKKDENMDNILSKIEHGAGSSRDDTLQTFQAEDSNDLLRQVQAIAEEGQGIGKDLFELPRCHRSPWHRIAIFISYIAGELPKIGKYNHVTLVLAPATRNLYSSGPMKHPDGAFVYELSGTASEFLLHATIQGQSIAIPRTNRLKNHHSKKKNEIYVHWHSQLRQFKFSGNCYCRHCHYGGGSTLDGMGKEFRISFCTTLV